MKKLFIYTIIGVFILIFSSCKKQDSDYVDLANAKCTYLSGGRVVVKTTINTHTTSEIGIFQNGGRFQSEINVSGTFHNKPFYFNYTSIGKSVLGIDGVEYKEATGTGNISFKVDNADVYGSNVDSVYVKMHTYSFVPTATTYTLEGYIKVLFK